MKSEQEYFRDVYESTYRDLLRYIVIKTRRADDAEDIMQQSYTSFFRRITRRGHRDIENPKAFLVAIANTELKKYYRFRILRRTHECEANDSLTQDDGDLSAACSDRALTDRVWELVRTASGDSYRAFVLHYSFGMSLTEIAAALDTTEAAVKSRLYRLRQTIRDNMKEELPS